MKAVYNMLGVASAPPLDFGQVLFTHVLAIYCLTILCVLMAGYSATPKAKVNYRTIRKRMDGVFL